jgi:hypothetical protein
VHICCGERGGEQERKRKKERELVSEREERKPEVTKTHIVFQQARQSFFSFSYLVGGLKGVLAVVGEVPADVDFLTT